MFCSTSCQLTTLVQHLDDSLEENTLHSHRTKSHPKSYHIQICVTVVHLREVTLGSHLSLGEKEAKPFC